MSVTSPADTEAQFRDSRPARLPGLPRVKGRLSSRIGLLDRPLTSYYLVLGITMLLLALGLVMVLSTSCLLYTSRHQCPCRRGAGQ